MRAAISLLVLLLSVCGVQTESHGTDASTQLDVSTELKELRDMLVELRADNVAVKQRLAASESKVEALEADNVAVKQRLAVSEAENVAVKQRLAASEDKVEALENEIKAAPKVAFSAALKEYGHGFTHSGSNDLNLVFKRVITNVGEAYSNTTGFFTAPVRGVYYFRFPVMDYLTSRWMVIKMYKNGEKLVWLGEYDTDRKASYLSSGLALQLDKGDTVNMVLPKGIEAGYRLWDNIRWSYSTFSGFLLFPL
ncbi:cerebellin-1-like [Engraulis encrasicolus]|uniref:cerebellin-1-like n=1 Tax=Engraulis encrasicolus TaxID=184585 RepID=UPI002FD52D5C